MTTNKPCWYSCYMLCIGTVCIELECIQVRTKIRAVVDDLVVRKIMVFGHSLILIYQLGIAFQKAVLSAIPKMHNKGVSYCCTVEADFFRLQHPQCDLQQVPTINPLSQQQLNRQQFLMLIRTKVLEEILSRKIDAGRGGVGLQKNNAISGQTTDDLRTVEDGWQLMRTCLPRMHHRVCLQTPLEGTSGL